MLKRAASVCPGDVMVNGRKIYVIIGNRYGRGGPLHDARDPRIINMVMFGTDGRMTFIDPVYDGDALLNVEGWPSS